MANRIEAAIHVWRLKDRKRHPLHSKGKKSWTGKVKGLVSDGERKRVLAQRAEGLLQSLRLRYPSLPQTVLDMNKIQHNKDVGQSILESYSRVMESLAFNIIARIDDLIYVDDATKRSSASESFSLFNRGGLGREVNVQKSISSSPLSVQETPFATPTFSSSTPISGSPCRLQTTQNKDSVTEQQKVKLEKLVSVDSETNWLNIGSLTARKDAGDAPERD